MPGVRGGAILRNMGALRRKVPCGCLFLAACALAIPAAGDEIRLKDGKKLYGTIVAYEDNMFRVKTEFGYVLVEKDKIASIIPTTPAAPKSESKPAEMKEAAPQPAKVEAKKEDAAKPQATPAATREVAPGAASSAASAPNKKEQAPKSTVAAATPAPATAAGAPANKPVDQSATAAPSGQPPARSTPPKEPEPPPIREEVQGNTYINYAYGFRIYKAPSWNLMDDARQALPNAIVALGTSAESTLMVIGREETKESLEKAAAGIEQRLREAYENYRRLEQKRIQVSGIPAIEYRYRGTAEDHDWSGTLVVVARGQDVFTVLGVTYADSDLIQIQENIIARAISSLDFSAR